MEKLKKMKAEHNHLFTDLLKATIFGLVMLAPLIAVASKCLYVTCNKNAKESYYGENINTFNDIKINSFDELVNGNTYIFSSTNTQTINNTANKRIYFNNINIIACSYQPFADNFVNCNSFTTTYYDGHAFLVPYNDSTSQTGLDFYTYNITFTFTLVTQSHPNNTYIECWDNFIAVREYNNYSFLDNAFYYAVDELGEQQLFSWTKNTAMYTTINTMTSGLDINGGNNTLAILLTYWALMTIVYVIFDIVIQVFVKITHFITE